MYDEVNFYLTLEVIEKLKNHTKSFVLYSSCELWNQYDGAVDLSMPFNFYPSPYLHSKYKISKLIMENIKSTNNRDINEILIQILQSLNNKEHLIISLIQNSERMSKIVNMNTDNSNRNNFIFISKYILLIKINQNP